MRKLLTALLVAAILLGVGAAAVNAQTFYQRFENIWAKTLRTTGATTVGGALSVTGASTLGTTSASALNVTGNGTVGGTFAATGATSFSDDLYLIPGDAITVTDGGTVTPATAVVELTAAGAVGAQMAAATDGRIAVLINTVNQTITISDTGSAKLAGDWAAGQYDTLTLVGQGVVWHELSRSDN